MGSRPRWNVEKLHEIVPRCDSYAQVIREIGLSDSSAGNYATVRKHIVAQGISTEHFVGQSWVGTRGYIPSPSLPLGQVLVENSTYSTHNLRVRLLKEGLFQWQCSSCKGTEWMGEPITLELDHINGVSNDHRIENLRMMCPNCHSYTPTWRGRNKFAVPPPKPLCACGNEMWYTSKECYRCLKRVGMFKGRVDWPSNEELLLLVKENNYVQVGKMFGVSDNAVRKRLKRKER